MTIGLAIWLSLWVALIAGFASVIRCSHFSRAFRIGPTLFVSAVSFALADRGLMVFGIALTAQQMPLRGYLIPSVIAWGAVTVITLLVADWRDRGEVKNERDESSEAGSLVS